MAAHPRRGPSAPAGSRKLRVEEARFYAGVYSSARKGSLNELRRKGCSEEEAEELFSIAFEKVMETVDPIARKFSAPQMVNFIKRTCWRCFIDERRRRGQRTEIELGAIRSLSDASAESPEEIAQEREAVAIGREALQMLSERDRVIFRQRHQMNLSPEEILQNTPGLSLRTYRKIIQRSNARVLEAFERIEGGERCQEMEGSLLRRYIADESPEAERLAVVAHLAHCRACQQTQARMRGYLLDVASGLIAASSLAGSSRLGALRGLPVRLLEVASNGVQSLAEASRVARERVREVFLRIVSGLPGTGGDASVGQALTATSVKVASVCVAGVAAGACVAAGVVPGVGGIGLLSRQHDHSSPPAKRAAHSALAPGRPSLIDPLPTPNSTIPTHREKTKSERHNGGGAEAQHDSSPSRPTSEPSAPVSNSPSSARESNSATSTEFGAESGQPASAPAPPPSSAPSGSSSSGSGASQSGHSSRSSGGSEFGL
ncbi:MAG TPA: sigma-70 family RNA polymerase sigma factor [Solirubrobacterales bacterium]